MLRDSSSLGNLYSINKHVTSAFDSQQLKKAMDRMGKKTATTAKVTKTVAIATAATVAIVGMVTSVSGGQPTVATPVVITHAAAPVTGSFSPPQGGNPTVATPVPIPTAAPRTPASACGASQTFHTPIPGPTVYFSQPANLPAGTVSVRSVWGGQPSAMTGTLDNCQLSAPVNNSPSTPIRKASPPPAPDAGYAM